MFIRDWRKCLELQVQCYLQEYLTLLLVISVNFHQNVWTRLIFNEYNPMHHWNVFQMIEQTQIIRQKDDQSFIHLLNRVRNGTPTEDDVKIIQSRGIPQDWVVRRWNSANPGLKSTPCYVHCVRIKSSFLKFTS